MSEVIHVYGVCKYTMAKERAKECVAASVRRFQVIYFF